jgi:hypothetical protein
VVDFEDRGVEDEVVPNQNRLQGPAAADGYAYVLSKTELGLERSTTERGARESST